MELLRFRFTLGLSVLAVFAWVGAAPCHAAAIAVFGDNGLDEFIDANTSHTTTLVTDSQIATAGFLDSFDAFLYTRDGASFVSSLSAPAAAEVRDFVTGNYVLLNGDFADEFPGAPAELETIVAESADFAVANGGGFIGELGGAGAALENGPLSEQLGFVEGTAGSEISGGGGSNGTLVRTSAGASHPITDTTPLNFDPPQTEFGQSFTITDPNATVLAEWQNADPAIVVGDVGGVVIPTPAAAMAIPGLLSLISLRRRQAQA